MTRREIAEGIAADVAALLPDFVRARGRKAAARAAAGPVASMRVEIVGFARETVCHDTIGTFILVAAAALARDGWAGQGTSRVVVSATPVDEHNDTLWDLAVHVAPPDPPQ